MSRTPTKELKSIRNVNFYPAHYLNSSLADDAKSEQFDGQKLAKARQQLEKNLQSLADGGLGRDDASSVRKELSERIFDLLGFFKTDGISSHQASLRIKNMDYTLHVDKRFPLKAEGDLWIIQDAASVGENGEKADSTDEELADGQSIRRGEVEHFYQKPMGVVFRNQPKLLAWKEVIHGIFDSDTSSCEWLIINQGDRLILTERGRWQEANGYLEVNLTTLFGINDPVEYLCVESLFSPKAFAIESAEFFHENLERNAHKKAAEVTKALRDTVRKSIEIIANEILANHQRKPLPSLQPYNLKVKVEADQAAQVIFDQSLRYIYRVLFMLFAESQERREGALPVQSRAYQVGYGIEHLRDLEGIPFLDKERNFIQQTIAHATRIYFKGYNTDIVVQKDESGEDFQKTDALGFSFPALGTDLFDDAKTSLFQEAVLADGEMQKVIRHLSLAKVGSGRAAKTQRVHYAGLGLNQLGAVYEGLLSLKPEILLEDAVLLAKDKKDMAHRYVPAKDKNKIDHALLAEDEDGLMTRKAGEFLLTPVGLERKFSASFYTPEVLTRFLAREAVETLLEKDSSIERLENLKICEPAMGSGAFLNAVVDELAPRMAREYRRIDQEALDKHIEKCRKQNLDPTKVKGSFVREMGHYLARAKFHLMQKCVFGVDLNPTAVELAKVSLWLNCLHDEGNLPFLDFKLKHGNSLVGCWVTRHQYEGKNWPHFLIPNPKALSPHLDGKVLGIKTWPFIDNQETKNHLKAVQKSWADIPNQQVYHKRLDALAGRVQQLYDTHLEYLSEYRQAMLEAETAAEKLSIFERFKAKNTAYNQLRSMMDYWCSLWFWPHSQIDLVPNGEEFLRGLEWMAETPLAYGGTERGEQIKKSALKELSIARDVALAQKFFHWDLEYADIFAEGGFDLVLGNPPWAPVKWEEEDFFEVVHPGIHLQKEDAKGRQESYKRELENSPELLKVYQEASCIVGGFVSLLRESGTYPLEDYSKINTYRFFYQRFHSLTKTGGIHSMIGQDGILSDHGCAEMRPIFYREVCKLYRFINEHKLFEDVSNTRFFLIWIAEKKKSSVLIRLIDNLYSPQTVSKCDVEHPAAPYPGMKDEHGSFETRGHPDRIIVLDSAGLGALAKFEPDTPWDRVKLPTIHGKIEYNVLKRLAEHPAKFDKINFYYAQMLNETNSPKAGLITRKPGSSKSLSHACMSGPNIFVGNPAVKVPNSGCNNQRDFSEVDLTTVPDSFFPDTVFQTTEKGIKSPEYLSPTPWGSVHSQEPRIIARQMVSTTGGRTLSSALIPPGPSHVHSMSSLSFKDHNELVYTSGLFHSLIYDFLMRSISGGTIGQGIYEMTPTLTPEQVMCPLVPALMIRALRLSCISEHYKPLWKEVWQQGFIEFVVQSPYMPELPYSTLTSQWKRHSCIRSTEAREQALCEIDAIVAILFGFEKETLLNLYRSQFGVLQKNLQDLPGQVQDPNKYHFPRFQQMAAAYDQCQVFLKDRGPCGKKVA